MAVNLYKYIKNIKNIKSIKELSSIHRSILACGQRVQVDWGIMTIFKEVLVSRFSRSLKF